MACSQVCDSGWSRVEPMIQATFQKPCLSLFLMKKLVLRDAIEVEMEIKRDASSWLSLLAFIYTMVLIFKWIEPEIVGSSWMPYTAQEPCEMVTRNQGWPQVMMGTMGSGDITCLLCSAQVLGIKEIKYPYSLYIHTYHWVPAWPWALILAHGLIPIA